jgi:peptidoglycan biosynthesis protein MviN/MurJ (putative lipid II flippase)
MHPNLLRGFFNETKSQSKSSQQEQAALQLEMHLFALMCSVASVTTTLQVASTPRLVNLVISAQQQTTPPNIMPYYTRCQLEDMHLFAAMCGCHKPMTIAIHVHHHWLHVEGSKLNGAISTLASHSAWHMKGG